MRLPALRPVGIVYRKEMLDLLRDRRTLFGLILLPILLYPALLAGLSQVLLHQIGRIERQEFLVAITGWQDLPDLPNVLQDSEARWRIHRAGRPEAGDLRRDLAAGRHHVLIEVPPNAARDVAAGGSVELRVLYNGANEDSLAAWRRLVPVLDRLRQQWVQRRLRDLAVDAALLEPIRVEGEDQATASQRGAFHLGRLICVMLVMMAATGAFYPAVDMASGEKERGTMQTLLVTPALRSEIVLGKYLAVLTLCLTTALLNLASMGLTFSSVLLPAELARAGSLAFAPTPGSIAVMLLVLLPLAGFLCAVCLGLSAYASTYKEAMLFLSPFLFVAVLGAMAPVIPGLQPTAGFQLIPVANGALVLYAVLQGTAGVGTVALNVAVNVLYALLALRWTAWIFEREDVLLRGAVEVDWRFWRRPAGPSRTHPSAAEGVAYLLVVIAGVTFAGQWLQGEPLVSLLVVTQAGAFFLPLLVMLRLGRIGARPALGLSFPGWTNLLVAVLTASGVFVLSLTLLHLLVSLLPGFWADLERQVKPIEEALARAGPAEWVGLAALLVLGAPLCEELAFRGFLLGALRPAVGTAMAVVLTGGLFGLLHPPMPRPLVLGAVGACFALMAVRTGSLWPAVAAHVVNNGLTVFLNAIARAGGPEGEAGLEGLPGLAGGPDMQAAMGGLALGVTVLGLLLLRSPSPGSAPGHPSSN